MTYETIAVRPLTPTIGAEVDGVRLSGDLPQETIDEIEAALLEHLVIFFRTPRNRSRRAHRLWPSFWRAAYPSRRQGDRWLPRVDEGSRRCRHRPRLWRPMAHRCVLRHRSLRWPASCTSAPCRASGGGDTLFANMYSAYESLSEPIQELLGGLTAIHDGGPNYTSRAKLGQYEDVDRVFPRAEHPIVRTHPATGRKSLYVNSSFTTGIVGVSDTEERALLDSPVRAPSPGQSFNAAFAGRPTRWPSGTTAVPSTTRCRTTTPRSARGIASPSPATNRSNPQLWR